MHRVRARTNWQGSSCMHAHTVATRHPVPRAGIACLPVARRSRLLIHIHNATQAAVPANCCLASDIKSSAYMYPLLTCRVMCLHAGCETDRRLAQIEVEDGSPRTSGSWTREHKSYVRDADRRKRDVRTQDTSCERGQSRIHCRHSMSVSSIEWPRPQC